MTFGILSAAVMAATLTPQGAAAPRGDLQEAPAGIRTYDYAERSVYPIWATPGRIVDIILEPGETLAGPVASGDTARWKIGDTISGAGPARRVHVLVKPITAPLATNLLITTDRRAYHLELRATARAWLSEVAWRYPGPPLVSAPPALEASAASEKATVRLYFGYRITGDRPKWRPIRVYDDGRQTFVEFADDRVERTLPPLYRMGADGTSFELIGYHVIDGRLVIDGLIDGIELRRGVGKAAQRVRILRDNEDGR